MPDNVTVDNGDLADFEVSADEATSGLISRVKLTYSADGSDTHVPADADGLLVNLGANNDVTVTSGAINATLQGSSAAIGKLAANSGVDIGDVDVTSVVPGTGTTNLGKAADSAAGATDTGVAVLGVRDDAVSAITPAEGDYAPLRVDDSGRLWVAAMVPDQNGDATTFSTPGELTASPSIFTNACAQYDSLHTAVMTFTGAANSNGGTGRILGARLINKHATFAGTIALHLFRKSVTGTTAGDTLSVSDTDKLEMIGSLQFDFSTADDIGGGLVQTADRSILPLDYKCDAGVDDLFGILQLTSADTPTFAASDLVPYLMFVAD